MHACPIRCLQALPSALLCCRPTKLREESPLASEEAFAIVLTRSKFQLEQKNCRCFC